MDQPAPYFQDVADGPEDVSVVWATAADGVRLRIANWPAAPGGKGTVLLFPGRTEYVEKYGHTVGDLAALGYGTITIDWRGQGLADRALDDRNTGHVMHFQDYQMDVAVLLDRARALDLPRPWYLLAHSMGGAIGLRAAMNGLPVQAAAFTAPMWGIAMTGLLRPVAWSLSWAARKVNLGHFYTPGTKPQTYVDLAAFPDNLLTTDPDMYAYMQTQLSAHPELALGGPSLQWLYEALLETREMAELPAPDLPTVTFLGGNERIVDTDPIHRRMRNWPGGVLQVVEGAEHEVLMETPQVRARVIDSIAAHFAAHR